MTDQLVYSTDNPTIVAAWRQSQADFEASRLKTNAEAAAFGKNKGVLVQRSLGRLRVIGLAPDDPQDPPDGWRYVREQLEPRRGKPGEAARQWLADAQPPTFRDRLEQEYGLPMHYGFLGTPGMFEQGGEVWVIYGGEPDGEVGPLWHQRKLSEFYAAKERLQAEASERDAQAGDPVSILLPAIVTIPAHPFEPMKRATDDGMVDDPMCGYHHRIDDETGVFCTATADHPVHHGIDRLVGVREWTDDEIDRCNR